MHVNIDRESSFRQGWLHRAAAAAACEIADIGPIHPSRRLSLRGVSLSADARREPRDHRTLHLVLSLPTLRQNLILQNPILVRSHLIVSASFTSSKSLSNRTRIMARPSLPKWVSDKKVAFRGNVAPHPLRPRLRYFGERNALLVYWSSITCLVGNLNFSKTRVKRVELMPNHARADSSYTARSSPVHSPPPSVSGASRQCVERVTSEPEWAGPENAARRPLRGDVSREPCHAICLNRETDFRTHTHTLLNRPFVIWVIPRKNIHTHTHESVITKQQCATQTISVKQREIEREDDYTHKKGAQVRSLSISRTKEKLRKVHIRTLVCFTFFWNKLVTWHIDYVDETLTSRERSQVCAMNFCVCADTSPDLLVASLPPSPFCSRSTRVRSIFILIDPPLFAFASAMRIWRETEWIKQKNEGKEGDRQARPKRQRESKRKSHANLNPLRSCFQLFAYTHSDTRARRRQQQQ